MKPIKSFKNIYTIPEDNNQSIYPVYDEEIGILKYILIFLIGVFITIIFLNFLIPSEKSGIDKILHQTELVITETVNKSEDALSTIKDMIETTTEENLAISETYFDKQWNDIKNKSRKQLMKIEEIKKKQVEEIEKDLNSFKDIIMDALNQILEEASDDILNIKQYVLSCDTTNVLHVMKNATKTVRDKLEGYFVDIDTMYTYYDNLVFQTIQHRFDNSTVKVSLSIERNPTNVEFIKLCYDVSMQNQKIVNEINGIVNINEILLAANKTLHEVIAISSGNSTSLIPLFHIPKLHLNNQCIKISQALSSAINDENHFLGSLIKKQSKILKSKAEKLTTKSLQNCVTTCYNDFDHILQNYLIVLDSHRQMIEVMLIDNSLNKLKEAMISKCDLLEDTMIQDCKEQPAMDDLVGYVSEKYQNATMFINLDFTNGKKYLLNRLKGDLKQISLKQIPRMSIYVNLSESKDCFCDLDYQDSVIEEVQNYLSSSYTKFINKLPVAVDDDNINSITEDLIEENEVQPFTLLA